MYNNRIARKDNKYDGNKLYDKYLEDEERGRRYSLTDMDSYSDLFYLSLTPNYKKVKRFTCKNCSLRTYREYKCPTCFTSEAIEKHHLVESRKQMQGCILGEPLSSYYDISGKLFVEIFKDKNGEYWIRYNKEAHKLWQKAYESDYDRNSRPAFTGSQGR